MTDRPVKTREESEADIAARLRRLDTMGMYIETVDVAGLLNWSQDTIRSNLVTIKEWRSSPPGSRTGVPSRRFGHRYKIPAMWVRDVLNDALLEAQDDTPGRTGTGGG